MRFMPKISHPIRLLGRPAAAYLANDLYYDYTRDAFNQNRAYAGLGFSLGQWKGMDLSTELYYMHQAQLGSKRRDWSGNHILGTKWAVKF
jgi:hypothetical protein